MFISVGRLMELAGEEERMKGELTAFKSRLAAQRDAGFQQLPALTAETSSSDGEYPGVWVQNVHVKFRKRRWQFPAFLGLDECRVQQLFSAGVGIWLACWPVVSTLARTVTLSAVLALSTASICKMPIMLCGLCREHRG